ncbi:hypothetical protein POM88_044062 [Heracleum sosnowskyi]|uniref:Uncharacterized protein n=1 Tax=Heracleum sosnowskyi TaxID=360622 RepID=A0AAD8H3K7_9APIA|nr:hypothetical protein POM88_044062 [Heracleum sosnowskyi]
MPGKSHDFGECYFGHMVIISDLLDLVTNHLLISFIYVKHKNIHYNVAYLSIALEYLHVYDKFKDLKKSCDVRSSDCHSIRPVNGERNKIFGAITFSCISRGKPLGEANVASSPFLENFPDVTLAGSFGSGEICCGDSSSYGQLSEHSGSHRCCLHYYSSVYFVMSYTPSLLGI